MARAVEERGRLVAVLPNRLLEVLSCGGVVSAHLSESRHGSSLDKLKPFGGSEPEESGRLPVRSERIEAGLRSEDLLVFVLEVVQEGVPFFECLSLDFGKVLYRRVCVCEFYYTPFSSEARGVPIYYRICVPSTQLNYNQLSKRTP